MSAFAFDLFTCETCKKDKPIDNMFVIKDYNEHGKPICKYFCKSCETNLPEDQDVFDYKCVICSCWMKESFFEHDGNKYACFECLGITMNDKMWPVNGDEMVDSYSASLLFGDDDTDPKWHSLLKCLIEQAFITKRKKIDLSRQAKAARREDIADKLHEWIKDLDRADASLISEIIDLHRSPEAEHFVDAYSFVIWMLALKEKE
jgi:hypothetical protein